jgi:hypothetical protein
MAGKPRRVYEYWDDEGNVYWSFTKHRVTVSPPRRLILQDRVGRFFYEFLHWFRTRYESGELGDDTDG